MPQEMYSTGSRFSWDSPRGIGKDALIGAIARLIYWADGQRRGKGRLEWPPPPRARTITQPLRIRITNFGLRFS